MLTSTVILVPLLLLSFVNSLLRRCCRTFDAHAGAQVFGVFPPTPTWGAGSRDPRGAVLGRPRPVLFLGNTRSDRSLLVLQGSQKRSPGVSGSLRTESLSL